MPELSQDNFEVLNPLHSAITPEMLRANSFGNNKKHSLEEFRGRTFTASDMDHSVVHGVGVDQYPQGYKREMDHRYVVFFPLWSGMHSFSTYIDWNFFLDFDGMHLKTNMRKQVCFYGKF